MPSCSFAAAYYTSFASVGLVVYFMRTRKGYRSLPEAINLRYGPLATLSFGADLFLLFAVQARSFWPAALSWRNAPYHLCMSLPWMHAY